MARQGGLYRRGADGKPQLVERTQPEGAAGGSRARPAPPHRRAAAAALAPEADAAATSAAAPKPAEKGSKG